MHHPDRRGDDLHLDHFVDLYLLTYKGRYFYSRERVEVKPKLRTFVAQESIERFRREWFRKETTRQRIIQLISL